MRTKPPPTRQWRGAAGGGGSRRLTRALCGQPAENGETWSDPLGRVVGVFEDTVPARK
jgi:hypothetical protein